MGKGLCVILAKAPPALCRPSAKADGNDLIYNFLLSLPLALANGNEKFPLHPCFFFLFIFALTPAL